MKAYLSPSVRAVAVSLGLTLFAGCNTMLPSMRGPANTGGVETIHKPETYTKFGDFRVNASLAEQATPEQARQFREEARISYQCALAGDANYRPAHLSLARLYVLMDDYPRGTAEFEKSLRLKEQDGQVWYELAQFQARHKDFAAATNSLRKAVEYDPENRRNGTSLGFLLAQQGLYPESLEAFSRVCSAGKAHYNLARILYHNNLGNLAQQQLQLALAAEPQLPEARAMLADLSRNPSLTAPLTAPAQPISSAPAPTAPVVAAPTDPVLNGLQQANYAEATPPAPAPVPAPAPAPAPAPVAVVAPTPTPMPAPPAPAPAPVAVVPPMPAPAPAPIVAIPPTPAPAPVAVVPPAPTPAPVAVVAPTPVVAPVMAQPQPQPAPVMQSPYSPVMQQSASPYSTISVPPLPVISIRHQQ
jgi:Tfp pilus assembly protein PilF